MAYLSSVLKSPATSWSSLIFCLELWFRWCRQLPPHVQEAGKKWCDDLVLVRVAVGWQLGWLSGQKSDHNELGYDIYIYIYIYIVRWEGVYPVLSMSDFMGRTIILVLICSDRCIGFPWMMAPSMGLSAPCLGFTSFQLPKWCCHRLPIHATTHKSQTPCSPKDTCLLFCILFSGTDDCIYCV